jgi:uncharacterized membrane protein YedE/YeeE
MTIILAIVLGFVFGFILHKIGATNPNKIIGMLRLQDLHLMKAIFFGIGFSSLLLFVLMNIGVISPAHLSVKSAYVGVFVGGMILAIGWVIAGFCPGTGVVAAGTGRKDAWFFILGGLVGAFIYMIGYKYIKGTALFDSLGGKTTLAVTGNEKFAPIFADVSGLLVAGSIAIVFMVLAFVIAKVEAK